MPPFSSRFEEKGYFFLYPSLVSRVCVQNVFLSRTYHGSTARCINFTKQISVAQRVCWLPPCCPARGSLASPPAWQCPGRLLRHLARTVFSSSFCFHLLLRAWLGTPGGAVQSATPLVEWSGPAATPSGFLVPGWLWLAYLPGSAASLPHWFLQIHLHLCPQNLYELLLKPLSLSPLSASHRGMSAAL